MVLLDYTDTFFREESVENLERYFFLLLDEYFSSTPPNVIALGVSGGPDSLALTYLYLRWTQVCATHVQLVPLIVDHGIRKKSSEEALQVRQWLRHWGLSPHILQCKGVGTNQAQWRQARYRALLLACHAQKISWLTLAHHQDDVLETVWMRQQASSEWRGKAGISSHRIQWNIHILRPLLAWPKYTMYRILQHLQHPWVEDPSNQAQHFFRCKARSVIKSQSLQERQALWKNILALSAQRHTESVRWYRQTHVVPFAGGYAFLWTSPCFMLPMSQGARILSQWVLSIMPRATPLKQAPLRETWKTILFWKEKKATPCIIFTLGGCVGIHTPHALYCFREWGRIIPHSPPETTLPWMWDHRFLFPTSITCRVSASGVGTKNLYQSLIPPSKDIPKYVLRWAQAAMPDCPEGTLYYPSVPCPIFSLPLGYKLDLTFSSRQEKK
ncbi:tRNA lysidine(34) synthetase TilS [Holospora curviuscula]|uniref:tRNA(Ile)-lysidine synthase n=1 Tax=Holospora curviuscula TaxID=1082868 RepID=A0A2S5RHV3_9PROT|nr:tRNA lysidine(34) synthetase TilS [Holospora curviuscula]PPE06901.1 tRNA(Ile)-lysidine synthase [Holospora curviuscula]